MLARLPVHAESARYARSLLFLPELWAPARIWLPVATFLGHRGWEGELVELRNAGGLAARTAAVAELVRAAAAPPVLIGHGLGALIGLETATVAGAAALVLVSPLLSGSPGARQLVRRWAAVSSILRGRDLPPPEGAEARGAFGEVPAGLGPDSARALLDVARGRPLVRVPLPIPTLVVAGAADPLLPAGDAAALAAMLGADRIEIDGAGHWPMLPPVWRRTAGLVHRWLIRSLGEPLLELYAEAMADREGDAD
jgi:pimeloyl-ACP methyl ester carboxylesterase